LAESEDFSQIEPEKIEGIPTKAAPITKGCSLAQGTLKRMKRTKAQYRAPPTGIPNKSMVNLSFSFMGRSFVQMARISRLSQASCIAATFRS